MPATGLPFASCFLPFTPIQAYLKELGWHHVSHFYDIAQVHADQAPLNNGWFAGPLDNGDYKQISRLLAAWDDDASRAAHLQFLAWRVHREEWLIGNSPVSTDDRYFISPILTALRHDERFLDAGAFDGSVSQRFIDLTNGSFGRIHAIEADRENALLLDNWRKSLPEDHAKKTFLCSSTHWRTPQESCRSPMGTD